MNSAAPAEAACWMARNGYSCACAICSSAGTDVAPAGLSFEMTSEINDLRPGTAGMAATRNPEDPYGY